MSRLRLVLVLVLVGALVATAACGDATDRGEDKLVPAVPALPRDGVVRDGTRVTATGRVVQVPDRPTRFCAPVAEASVGYAPGMEPPPAYCDFGVNLTGADLAGLTNRREKEGAVEGWATITGTYADGTVTVETQEPAPATGSQPATHNVQPPCDEPPGGWPRDPRLLHGPGYADEGDINMMAEQPALERYRSEHPGQIVEVALLRPYPDAVLMGVIAASDEAREAVEAGLRPAYGKRLCVVTTRYTPEQIRAARDDLSPITRRDDGIYGGGGISISDDLQVRTEAEAVMLTEELDRAVRAHPDGLAVVRPWLVPAS
jgi:hypothetical protein